MKGDEGGMRVHESRANRPTLFCEIYNFSLDFSVELCYNGRLEMENCAMKRTVAVLLALSLSSSAFANKVPPPIIHKPPPPPPAQHQPGLGAGPWIAGGLIGCASVGVIGYGAYIAKTQHRELTCREASMIVWGCFVPVIGAMVVDAAWKRDPSLEKRCTTPHEWH